MILTPSGVPPTLVTGPRGATDGLRTGRHPPGLRTGIPAAALLPRPRPESLSVRHTGAGGLRGAVHARRQPHEMAPRSHQLVLRALPAAGAPAGLRPLPRRLRLPVQLLLLHGGADAPPAGTRVALPAHR